MTLGSSRSWVLTITAALLLLSSIAPRAKAQDPTRHRTALLPFQGPGATQVRKEIERILSRSESVLYVTRPQTSLATPDGAMLTEIETQDRIARALSIGTWVQATVTPNGQQQYRVEVQVVNAADHAVLHTTEYRGRSAVQIRGTLRRQFWHDFGEALQQGEVPAEKTIPATSSKKHRRRSRQRSQRTPSRRTRSTNEATRSELPPFSITADLLLFSRQFSYNDDLFNALREYNLELGPALHLEAAWFPLAHFMGGTPSKIGMDFTALSGLALNSGNAAGSSFPTQFRGWSAGLRYREKLGGVELSGRLAYGSQSFRIEAADINTPAPEIPSVDYTYMHLGVVGRSKLLGPISARGHAAWLPLMGMGQLQTDDWFPRITGGGAEASLRLLYQYNKDIEFSVGVLWRYFYFSMNPEPGDPWVAGGGFDRYWGGTIGATWRPGQDYLQL